MSKFQDNLWRDLVREHGAAFVEADRPRPGARGVLRRPRVLAGGSLGLAGVGTALALVLTAGGAAAPAAFAITTHRDGSLAVNLDTIGGLVGVNQKLAKMGYDEHIDFTMGQGPAATAGVVDCTPTGSVSGPPVTVTVGPGTTNTETIAAGNTGAGVWHVVSCTRSSGAEPHPLGVANGVALRNYAPAHVNGDAVSTGTAAFNLDQAGGLAGVDRLLAGMGADEHINFTMAQGAAAQSGPVDCTPANAGVNGADVTVTVGPGDSNTETIASGNTGTGTWHVASCTRDAGNDPNPIQDAR